MLKNQFCGTGTGSAGTVNFCLAEPECVSGSGSGSGAGFGSGYNIKSNKKSKEGNFLGNNAASDIEKVRFCTNFIL